MSQDEKMDRSTMVNLALRFAEATSGNCLVDVTRHKARVLCGILPIDKLRDIVNGFLEVALHGPTGSADGEAGEGG